MSGDWIDVVDLADGRVALAIGDAAGHDDQASALALVLRSLMHRRLRAGADPADVVSGALDEITELGDMGERFATAFVAIAEPDGTVIYANAGHPPPVVLPGPGAGRQRQPLAATGPIISDLFAGTAIWSTRTLRLEPGDALLLYTDGLTEARDAAGTQFGLARLTAEGTRPATCSAVLDHVFAEVTAYASRPADDRSALVLAPTAGRSGEVRSVPRARPEVGVRGSGRR
jgi:serine phosphatase RsbU (regulator of sigma subunit)